MREPLDKGREGRRRERGMDKSERRGEDVGTRGPHARLTGFGNICIATVCLHVKEMMRGKLNDPSQKKKWINGWMDIDRTRPGS